MPRPRTDRAIAAALFGFALAASAALCAAAEPTPLQRSRSLPGLEPHLSAQETHALQSDGLAMTAHQCGCYDKPKAHFPYTLLIVRTPERELVVRPEGQESAFRFELLAVRSGDTYCAPDANQTCFGDFATPCEFTDFRYGALLAQFFPTCKASND